MEKNKKQVLIIIGFILAVIALLAILLSIFLPNDKKPSDNPEINNNPLNENTIKKDITKLEDVNKFFSTQKIINDFYTLLNNRETNKLLKVLDSSYIKSKGITENNLYQNLNSNYEITTYVAKNIYYNPNSSITYYFINGYLINDELMGDNSELYENINYLIIVDEITRNYTINPLDSNIQIESYAKSYSIESKTITNDFRFTSISVTEENKLTTYLSEFLNLLVYDNNKAYNLLETETKKEYQNYNDFKNQMVDIYSRFSSKIFSYSKKEEGNNTIYYIKDDNQNDIIITEKGIMDYSISY